MLAWKRGDLLGALQRLWVAYIATALVLLVAFYVTYGGPVLAVLGLGLAAWLAAAVLTELADRVRLFRVPAGDSLRRAVHLPRASLRHDAGAFRAGGVGRRLRRLGLGQRGDRDPEARRPLHVAGYELPWRASTGCRARTTSPTTPRSGHPRRRSWSR